jgi:hypothetical protein
MTTDTINPNQALWEKGDFTRIAATMRESGEDLVAGLGITVGSRVLDLGCGDGTTALRRRPRRRYCEEPRRRCEPAGERSRIAELPVSGGRRD